MAIHYTTVGAIADEVYDGKPTKVIHGRFYGLWKSPTHVIALIPTGVLVYLAFSNIYWFPDSGPVIGSYESSPNEALNWLQLAAKLYELLVVASLAAITLKVYKRRFVDNGVPLGLLSGGYRVGDLKYLISSKFLAHLIGGGGSFLLALLLLICTVLAVLAGPASAILIVPELGWFSFPRGFSNVSMPVYLDEPEKMWPPTLSEDVLEDEWNNCLVSWATLLYRCPAAGYSEIATWASGWSQSILPSNLTFQTYSGILSRRLQMQRLKRSGTLFTTPMAFAVDTVGQLQAFIAADDVGGLSSTEKYKLKLTPETINYQPLVNAKCQTWDLEEYDIQEKLDFRYPSWQLNCPTDQGDDDCHRTRNNLESYAVSSDIYRDDGLAFGFDTITNDDERKPDDPILSSAVLAARLPYLANDDTRGAHLVACSYVAHWIPAVLISDPSNSEIAESNVTDLGIFNEDNFVLRKRHGIVGRMIQIDKSWLPYITLGNGDKLANNTNAVNSINLYSLFGSMMMTWTNQDNETDTYEFFGPGTSRDPFPEIDIKEQIGYMLERVTGTLLTDAIARTPGMVQPVLLRLPGRDGSREVVMLAVREGPNALKGVIYDNGTTILSIGQSETIDLGTLVTFDFDAERFGYGFQSSGRPKQFALGVILTYVVIMVLYLVYVFIFEVNTVTAWGDLQDLLALTWNSPVPSELRGLGTSVSESELWKKRVLVRAMPSEYATLALAGQEGELMRLRETFTYR